MPKLYSRSSYNGKKSLSAVILLRKLVHLSKRAFLAHRSKSQLRARREEVTVWI